MGEALIKAGICGICSLILVPLGLLFTSVIFLVPGIWMCYYAWKKVWNDGNPGGSSQAGVVIQTPVAQPLMTNSQPQPSGSASYPVQPTPQVMPHYNPQQPHQQPPLQGGAYPPGSYPQPG